jgi:hypothetical protein
MKLISYTHPCKSCKVTYILHYLPQGGESSPRGGGICTPALPEVLTRNDNTYFFFWYCNILQYQYMFSHPWR